MLESARNCHHIEAPLNFAASKANGGIWCNTDRSKITQELVGCAVRFNDATTLATPPSIEREGFEVCDAPLPETPLWEDRQWVAEVYIPHCAELIRRITGSPRVGPMDRGFMIRDTGNLARAPAAEFVHLDLTEENGHSLMKQMSTSAAEPISRLRIFNVWRATTRPPQDVPLALCDQRTLSKEDWVYGTTIAVDGDSVPYVTSTYNARQDWYYFPALNIDQAIVFKNFDSELRAHVGCLHGAFRLPDPSHSGVPRASVEARIFVLT